MSPLRGLRSFSDRYSRGLAPAATSCRRCAAERDRKRKRRRGLAPLEFVLWLPVLLFVMALMVNYGTMATWRVRSEVISRHAAWRTRWPRPAGDEGAPDRPFWPDDAAMTTAADNGFDILDVPAIDHAVVRGPIPNDFVVRQVLNPTRGAYKGVSQVQRELPLLPRLGDYNSGDVDTPLIDHKWQVATMRNVEGHSIPNVYRRTKVLYVLPQTDPGLPQAFSSAVKSVLGIPHYNALAILDRDADFIYFRGSAPDFHPRVGRGCEIDPEIVREDHVIPLIDVRGDDGEVELHQISLLPRTMTNAFLSLYRWVKQTREQWIEDAQEELNGTPPPPPDRVQELQALIAQWQSEIDYVTPKIEQLEEYEARLPQIEQALKDAANAVLP